MSRSRKKNIGGGNTGAPSERQDKRIWHKSFRRTNKTILKNYDTNTETNLKTVKEMSDPWVMDKDGKYMYTELEIKSFIDVVINEIHRTDTISWDFNGHGYPAFNIYRELCSYLKKRKKNTKYISNITKNKFIEYYMNKEKRK